MSGPVSFPFVGPFARDGYGGYGRSPACRWRAKFLPLVPWAAESDMRAREDWSGCHAVCITRASEFTSTLCARVAEQQQQQQKIQETGGGVQRKREGRA